MNHNRPSSSRPRIHGRRAINHARGTAARRAALLSRRSRQADEAHRKLLNLSRSPALKKKLAFVTHLLRSLDLLVYAELSALYYMECSMFRLFIRAAGQYMYLTPKHESFPFLMPVNRLHVLFIIIPNIACILLHLFSSLPVGPDHHRGYQHGGLIIDFVGQRPSTSRLYYILADIFIVFLQCLMLTIHSDREKLRLRLKTFKPLVPGFFDTVGAERTLEELDAEERGIAIDVGGPIGEGDEDGIEMRALGQTTAESGRDEAEGGGDEIRRMENTSSSLLDIMNSGNGMLGEFHIVHTIRTGALDLNRTAAQSLQSLSYGATLAALRARQRTGLTSTTVDETNP